MANLNVTHFILILAIGKRLTNLSDAQTWTSETNLTQECKPCKPGIGSKLVTMTGKISYRYSTDIIQFHISGIIICTKGCVCSSYCVELLQFNLKPKSKTVIFQVLGTICAPNFRVFNPKINQVVFL